MNETLKTLIQVENLIGKLENKINIVEFEMLHELEDLKESASKLKTIAFENAS